MSVFMEKNGRWEGISHLPGELTLGQGISPYLPLVCISSYGSVSKPDRHATERNVRFAITVFSRFIKKGGASRKEARK